MSDRKQVKSVPPVPARDEMVIVGQDCDKCGQDIPHSESYKRRDFKLEFLEGDSYPDSTDLEGWTVPDLCDNCLALLKKLLEENGFKIVPHSVSY